MRAALSRRSSLRPTSTIAQRGALALSPDGASLCVMFGETVTGWVVALDTTRGRVRSAFATVANPHHSSGGIWGAGGPAIDSTGDIFVGRAAPFRATSTNRATGCSRF